MGSPKREPGGSEELRDRIIILGNDLWGGSRSRMATDLEQSQSSITRVMTRQQAPSGRLIENLAKHPDVDLNWLFRGEGEPKHRPESISMPVFTRLIGGHPNEANRSSAVSWQSLATRHYRPTRYWLRIQGVEPITESPGQGIVAGDMILMETDRTAFRKPGTFVEQLCGVRFGKETLKLAMVECDPPDEQGRLAPLGADTFDLGLRPEKTVREYLIRHQPGRKPTVTTQEKVVSTSGKSRHKTFEDLEPRLPDIKFNQIVCMAVLVLRRDATCWAV